MAGDKESDDASKDATAMFEVKNVPDPAQCIYYQLLNSEEQALYDIFLEGLLQHQEQIMLDTKDDNLIYDVYEMILADHPELFWVDGGYSYIAGRMNTNVMPVYSYSVKDAARRQKQIVKAGRAILKEIASRNLVTDYEKVKAVFEYIVFHVDYNTESSDNQNLYSALVNKESVCAGYTKMTQYLLQQMGIPAVYISGEVWDVGSHAWNMVQCNGRYYLVDSTFGDCAFQDESVREYLPESMNCDYNYLCCSEDMLMQDRESHTWRKLPVCDHTDLNYYALQRRYYSAVDDILIRDMEESIREGEPGWSCQFTNREAYDDFMSRIQDSFYLKKVLELRDVRQVQGYSTYNEHFLSVSCWYTVPE